MSTAQTIGYIIAALGGGTAIGLFWVISLANMLDPDRERMTWRKWRARRRWFREGRHYFPRERERRGYKP